MLRGVFPCAVAGALCMLIGASLIPVNESAVNGSDHINIWIITHTHDDVGWLETVDGYYIDQVQWILDTAIRCLMEDPARKFTYVEMAYFYRWWNEQTPEMKQAVVKLAKSGQLEFNLAGWCMNDEAATSYFSVINQMTEGALFLHDQLDADIYPKVGWHVDPFGHSSVTPSLWADMGFDAFGINRIDFRDKDQRKADKELEFIWRGSRSLGSETEIFAHIMDSAYCTPGECGYDGNLKIQNDPLLPTYPLNFVGQGDAFVKMARARNQWYIHDHILIPFGCDFAHQNAFKSFDQMDKLIDYVNSNSTLNATVKYGTFGEYIQAINALNLTWPVYTGDFFPYASNYGQYWTGYYTSRAHLKGYVRSRAALLRATELLVYWAAKTTKPTTQDTKLGLEQLGLMRRALGVVQHHDGVSGTEKQAVADDYYLQLYHGTVACEGLSALMLGDIIQADQASPPVLYQNSSQVFPNMTSEEEISVVAFNSLAWERDVVVSVPTNLTNLVVKDGAGKSVVSQLLAMPPYNPEFINKTTHELLFAVHLPAYGYETFFLSQGGEAEVSEFINVKEGDTVIENTQLMATFSATTHRLSSLGIKASGKTIAFDNNLVQYTSAAGNSEPNSGAYVFRPAQDNLAHVGQQKTGAFHSTGWHFYDKQVKYEELDFPLLISTPACQPGTRFSDSFVSSTGRTDVYQTSFHIWRTDGAKGWSQDLWMNYAILDPAQAPLSQMTGYQFGYVEIKPSADYCAHVEVPFKSGFTSVPGVVLGVESRELAVHVFAATVHSISQQSATVNVCRADGIAGGWKESIYLTYVAWNSASKADSGLVQFGSFSFSANVTGPRQTNVTLENFSVFRGVIVATAMSKSGAVYSVTTYNATSSGFGVNVQSLEDRKWDDEITVNWLIFQRNTVESPVMVDENITTTVTSGPIVQEVRQVFKDRYAITTRLYQGASPNFQFLEQTFDIGPLDQGRELVSRYETNISNPTWYSDDTGLELIPRQFDPSKDEPVAGNYYPMVMGSFMNDSSDAIALSYLSERSHGSGSLGDGQLEVMLHRRCLQDDHFGVGEVLNETDHIRPRLWLVPSDDPVSAYNLRRKLSLELQNPPMIMYSKASAGEWAKMYKPSQSAMSQPLPDNVHLLSVKARNDTADGSITEYLYRFQHVFEKNEPTPLAAPVTIDTENYFAPGTQPSLTTEVTLSGNRDRSSVSRLTWRTAAGESYWDTSKFHKQSWNSENANTVQLVPRQIRTFLGN